MPPRIFDLIRSAVRAWLGIVPPRPRPLTLARTRELTVLRYTFTLPPEPQIDDLDHREANVAVVGGETDTHTIAKGSTEFVHDFDRDVNVSITLVDVDTSGNKSAPSDPLAFVTSDTVPPPQPGGLAVSKVEQV